MTLAYVLFGYLAIALIDLPLLIKKKMSRELVVFTCLFVTGLTIAILHVIGITVPSPMIVMGDIMKMIHLSY